MTLEIIIVVVGGAILATLAWIGRELMTTRDAVLILRDRSESNAQSMKDHEDRLRHIERQVFANN